MYSKDNNKNVFLASLLLDGLEDNNLEQIKTLLKKNGANPNVLLPVQGVTPFHLAVGNECEGFAEDVTKLFLAHGGDPNVKTSDGMTPVHTAACWGKAKILNLLLSSGGDPFLIDDDGKSPLDYALEGGHSEAAAILQKFNEKDDEDDENDDSNKVEIKLKKIFINSRDYITEYVISDDYNCQYDDIMSDITNLTSTNTISTLNNNLNNNLREEDFNFNDFHNKTIIEDINFNIKINSNMNGANDLSKCQDKNTQTKYFDDNLSFNKVPMSPRLLETSVLSKSPNLDLTICPKKLNNQSMDNLQLKKDKSAKYYNLLTNLEMKKHSDFMDLMTEDDTTLFKEENALPVGELDGAYSSEIISTSGFTDAKDHFHSSGNSDEVFRTPVRSTISSISFITVDEEYSYLDTGANVSFVERRLRVIPPTEDMDCVKNESSWVERLAQLSLNTNGETSQYSTDVEKIVIGNNSLRHRLITLGDTPGPVTATTRSVYLKKLRTLEKKVNLNDGIWLSNSQSQRDICKIPKDVISIDWMKNLEPFRKLEDKVFREYEKPSSDKKYRGGIAKMSFNYMLLDPRITNDLPRNGNKLSIAEKWEIFLKGIFYVGKGKAARPATHLYDAFHIWNGKKVKEPNEKIQRILDIWKNGKGVVCLQVFTNRMQEESFTREAAIIDAIGLNHLCNKASGNYYGIMATVSDNEKRDLGKYLLYKAMKMFMNEGELQLFPANIE